MSKALIITSYLTNFKISELADLNFDYIICADGGYNIACDLGLYPNIIVGDFDSMDIRSFPSDIEVFQLPSQKNITDTEASIKKAISLGCDNVTILGGLGGRFDHSLGNIALLSKYSSHLKKMYIKDGQNFIFLLENSSIKVQKNRYKFISVISHSDISKGVSETGVKYPLSNVNLDNSTTLGISNEIIEDYCTISVLDGKLIIILSQDIDNKPK